MAVNTTLDFPHLKISLEVTETGVPAVPPRLGLLFVAPAIGVKRGLTAYDAQGNTLKINWRAVDDTLWATGTYQADLPGFDQATMQALKKAFVKALISTENIPASVKRKALLAWVDDMAIDEAIPARAYAEAEIPVTVTPSTGTATYKVVDSVATYENVDYDPADQKFTIASTGIDVEPGDILFVEDGGSHYAFVIAKKDDSDGTNTYIYVTKSLYFATPPDEEKTGLTVKVGKLGSDTRALRTQYEATATPILTGNPTVNASTTFLPLVPSIYDALVQTVRPGYDVAIITTSGGTTYALPVAGFASQGSAKGLLVENISTADNDLTTLDSSAVTNLRILRYPIGTIKVDYAYYNTAYNGDVVVVEGVDDFKAKFGQPVLEPISPLYTAAHFVYNGVLPVNTTIYVWPLTDQDDYATAVSRLQDVLLTRTDITPFHIVPLTKDTNHFFTIVNISDVLREPENMVYNAVIWGRAPELTGDTREEAVNVQQFAAGIERMQVVVIPQAPVVTYEGEDIVLDAFYTAAIHAAFSAGMRDVKLPRQGYVLHPPVKGLKYALDRYTLEELRIMLQGGNTIYVETTNGIMPKADVTTDVRSEERMHLNQETQRGAFLYMLKRSLSNYARGNYLQSQAMNLIRQAFAGVMRFAAGDALPFSEWVINPRTRLVKLEADPLAPQTGIYLEVELYTYYALNSIRVVVKHSSQ